ncbi:hypothetical protein [Amycolatopsis sp. NPDC051071]|uniref:hypothetical protein n=1 Tax=Amycolatopsis sp. NPDC051071 TaxID=3154637 RepID=UPI0034393D8F
MSVVLYLDQARLQPVLDDAWHRVAMISFTGGTLTTLCGETDDIEYKPAALRPGALKTCWECDTAYRRSHNIASPPGGRHT